MKSQMRKNVKNKICKKALKSIVDKLGKWGRSRVMKFMWMGVNMQIANIPDRTGSSSNSKNISLGIHLENSTRFFATEMLRGYFGNTFSIFQFFRTHKFETNTLVKIGKLVKMSVRCKQICKIT